MYCLITVSSVQVLPDVTNKVVKQFLFSSFAVKGNSFVHFFPIKLKFSILCLPHFAVFGFILSISKIPSAFKFDIGRLNGAFFVVAGNSFS